MRMRRRGRHIHLDDAGPGGEQLAEAHGELVERGAEHHGDIRAAHQLHRRRCAEPAGHAEVVLFVGEDAATERRGCGHRPGPLGERTERLPRAGQPRTPAGQEERPLRDGERTCGVGDRRLRERAGRFDGMRHHRLETVRNRSRLAGGHVVRDRQHGRHPVGEGVLDRDDRGGRRIRPAHGVGARADGRGERDLVHIPRAGPRRGLVTNNKDERRFGLHRLGERGQRVREAGPVGGRRGREPTGCAVVRIRRHDGTRLVAQRGVRDGPLALERIQEVGVAVAHHAEHLVDVAGESGCDVRGDG